MRTHLTAIVGVALVTLALGCSDDSPTAPGGTLTGISLPQGIDLIRINTTETFTLTAAYTDGTVALVQGNWTSDAAGVARVDANGRVTGVSSGHATIIGEHQGLRATRLLRVVPDYHGRWHGDAEITTCTESGDWVGICASQFRTGDLFGFTLAANQTRDTITGTTDFGDNMPGAVTGTIATNGHLAVSGTYTLSDDDLALELAVSNWDTTSIDNETLTGRFRVTMRAPDLQGTAQVDSELRGVTKVSPTPTSGGASATAKGLVKTALAQAASRKP